jgi:Na+-driven multidrug efflux pump
MLVFSVGAFILVSIWTNIFASFLNGVGKIRVSVIVSVAAMFLNIPVGILLAKYTSIDASAVVIGMVIALMPGVFSGPYQTYKILSCRDAGIWGR